MSKQPLVNGETGATVVLPGTKAACILRPLYFNGVDESSFHILPQDRLYANWPRIRGKVIPYETYITYGKEWFSRSCLFLSAVTKSSDPAVPPQRFALKVAFNVVDGKPCHQFLRNFCIEARFYARRLKHLQGKAVPKHYGVWTCSTPWGGTMACAILEWGGVPFKEEFIPPGEQGGKQRCVPYPRYTRIILISLNSLDIMYAMKAIHDVGYEHTDLVEPGFRHLLYDTERQRPYIIDFSRGEKHKCHPRMAIKAYKTPPDPYVFGCMELRDLGVAIGLFGLGPLFGPDACPEVQEANRMFELEQLTEKIRKRVTESTARRLQFQAQQKEKLAKDAQEQKATRTISEKAKITHSQASTHKTAGQASSQTTHVHKATQTTYEEKAIQTTYEHKSTQSTDAQTDGICASVDADYLHSKAGTAL
ncbi:hypothetical protein FB107DRAFT_198708 [Schizophyllum commune]